MTGNVVIVGAGHGAGQCVASLRQFGFAGGITLIGDESWYPYQRPPLSKKYLAGELDAERLHFKPVSFYADVDVHRDTRVVAVDRNQQVVRTASNAEIPYENLVLATGSRARRLPVDGADLAGVHYLRSIDDVDSIRQAFGDGKNLVIIGAGYIGLEVAAVAVKSGLDVTVVEAADRVMSRVVSPQLSAFYYNHHVKNGVRFHLSASATAFYGDGQLEGITLDSGIHLDADLAVIGIGILPNTELAEDAGLPVDDGIIVDDHCRTADPRIYAIGDCTRHPSDILGRTIRLESVHNALEQAKTAAANLCGKSSSYQQVPWFWSDQYDLKLQIAGISAGYDETVLRGNMKESSFAWLYLKDGKLIAVDAVNRPRDFMQAKALIANHARIASDTLADADVMLKDMDY